ncbi:M24 family metallopeptidase [Geomicrobium sp. JCM 19038]|uniref:M24 family metallopeptidase n=1 Tax=Geomicrobium sp. JCM 19038 TaxID=1460635 RepID=UPI00045F1EA0|nr:M24 family metallopeptidase [Geomicrobium sp. JCM 19038]GAK06718.1 Xaa-Pro dipeptidase [Geomicrobium sp. JCM 19038]
MFSREEYQLRMNKTKQKMLEYGVEVLILSNPSNLCYLTGYNAWSFYVHQVVLVLIDEEEPIWIGREMDAHSAKTTTWIDHTRIIPYPDEFVQSTIKHPMDFVANILTDLGQGQRKVGVEMDAFYYTAMCHERLTYGLPEAEFKNTSTIVNWVRLQKSPAEITFMRRAAKIVEKAMQAAYDKVDVGVRENDVAAAIYHAQVSGTAEFGGDYTSIVPMLPTGKNTASPHLTWTDKRYKEGDFLTIEIAGCYQRYHAPLARTMAIKKAPKEIIDVGKVVTEGIEETLNFMKPGVTAEQVEEVWRESIGKHGFIKASRLGYSIGLSYPPDWGEHTISFRKGDRSLLEPGMTFHLMPGIWFDEFGVEITESVLITDNGVETLTNFPRDVYEKTM